jgi:hypothetical protein
MDYSVGSYSEGKTLNGQLVSFCGWITLIILAVTIGSNLITGSLLIQIPYFSIAASSIIGWVLIIVTLLGMIISLFGRK